ncbi:DUF6660 domain-containing protein [Mucilaginibacter galii]|uniref:DUF6660 family protein n=1 Tax=Mucilaginibacter galii TaxID=2005073 RepID=UPI00166EDC9C|nr:DUF6660 family protein [Mucilaginibacter galii]
MKLLAILFSVYMILLAVLPCRDSDDFSSTLKANTSLSQSHSADEKGVKETCTPFCTCACCSTVRTIHAQQAVTLAFVQPIVQVYGETLVPAILEQSISVWQPPQIG